VSDGFDPRRARLADWLTAAWGIALFAALRADWFERPEGGVSAWEAFGFVDLWLLLTAILAVAVPLVAAARRAPAVPLAVIVVTVTVALLALVMVLYRLVDEPGINAEVDLGAGAWIGALCTLGVFVSAAHAVRDERSPGLEPVPEVPVAPAPPKGA